MTGEPAEELAAALGVRVVAVAETTSTMDLARADAGPLPAVWLAGRQTAGRGRRGTGWESPPGNLHATLGWPDPDAAWPPSLLAAIQLAWAEAVEAAGGPAGRVRWPNDGVLPEGKWAGALAERDGARLLVGLGADLAVAPALPRDAPPAAALAAAWPAWPGAAPITRLLLAAALDVLRDGPAALPARLAAWPARDALRPGEAVAVETPAGRVEGTYAGVAPDGRLRVATGSGERLLAVGVAVRLRPAGAAA